MDVPAFVDLPDLACEAVGGAAIACNDEFFAEKEALLRAHDAEWKAHEYTDRGKWMDGWETRRRREPGHDWCIVRLGMPGVIRGVVVDTAYFRGNFPESCRLFACETDEPLDLGALDRVVWTEILPRSPLHGDSKNYFEINYQHRFTHVRLEIFPDGGVARLRIHGEVQPRWDKLRAAGTIDLAALDNGAWVETCSDMFFGSRNNLIKPGPSRSMADGWETRRRRGPGNDWAIIRLAAEGTLERLDIDTTHFKGNAPGRCVVEARRAPDERWRVVMESPLQPHRRHPFDDLRRTGPVSHLRLSVFPDGGVARLRAWGSLVSAPDHGLTRLNTMPDGAAALRRCCGSTRWAEQMAAWRPFEDVHAMLRIAEKIWWSLDERDYLEAFAAHPKIGSSSTTATTRAAGEADMTTTATWSRDEQRGAAAANDSTLAALADGNRRYADKYGFIYIVCATGKSADDMFAILDSRLNNPRDVELQTAAEEQAKITRLRLQKLVVELASDAPTATAPTTGTTPTGAAS